MAVGWVSMKVGSGNKTLCAIRPYGEFGMIYESSFWKDDLLRIAADLDRRRSQRRWVEASFAAVEKSVMVGCYIVRKLIEAKKLSDETVERPVVVASFSALGRPVHHLNRTKYWELYDLDFSTQTEIQLIRMCHLIIHSYGFHVSFSMSDEFDGVLFNSDRTRHDLLYHVHVAELIRVFREVGEDYPSWVSMEYDERQRDYRFVSKTVKPNDN